VFSSYGLSPLKGEIGVGFEIQLFRLLQSQSEGKKSLPSVLRQQFICDAVVSRGLLRFGYSIVWKAIRSPALVTCHT
jgi:hypothetical protein